MYVAFDVCFFKIIFLKHLVVCFIIFGYVGIQFCLFNSPPDVAFRIVSANNFALLSAILSVVLGYGGRGEDEYRQLDENRETLKLAVQVLFW